MNVRKATSFLGVLLMLIAVGARSSAAESGYTQALRAHSARLRGMLVAIVGAMPEDKYDFRPVKEVRSFREMVVHLTEDIYTHAGYVMGQSREESAKVAQQNAATGKTREDYLKALGGAYDYADKMLAGITDENAMDSVTAMRGMKATRVEAALELFEDQMDHYGNFVVYLRLNGVVPPDTAENMERMKMQKQQQNQGHQ